MKNSKIFIFGQALFALLLGLTVAPPLEAAALKGFYRLEGLGLNASSSFRDTTVYGAHQFTLQPSIVASDGVFIEGRFHILGSPSLSWPETSARALGAERPAGQPADQPGATSPPVRRKAGRQQPWQSQWGQAFGRNMLSGAGLQVAELYATFDHGRGLLAVGRQALPFGMGLLYHGGRGAQDHWYKSYDMLAYRLQWGRLQLTPMLALEPDALHYVAQLDYSHENNFQASLMYKKYKGTLSGLPTEGEDFDQNSISAYYEKSLANFKLQVEGHYIKGSSPVEASVFRPTPNGLVDQNTFAFAARGEFTKGPWVAGVDAGFARGDKDDTNELEAFALNPNFDPTVLMFNYAATGGTLTGDTPQSPGTQRPEAQRPEEQLAEQRQEHLDSGVLTNAVYVAPRLKRNWNTKWASQLGAAVGWRAQDFSYLGAELSGGLEYTPHPRLSWSTWLAFMMPGQHLQSKSSLVYGARSSVVVHF